MGSPVFLQNFVVLTFFLFAQSLAQSVHVGLSFVCPGEWECGGDTFYCVDPDTGNDNPICNITCSGSNGCNSATFVIANTGGLQLNCPDYASCAYSEIVWVNSDNLATYKSVDANAAIGGPLHRVDCGDASGFWFTCYLMEVAGDTQQLGLDTVTQLNCAGDKACLDATAFIRGSIAVDCIGGNSCDGFELTCMSGAKCETFASNADAATGASMTCDSGVQSCVCSEFFDCFGFITEPMTSTAEASTTTADPSTSTTLAETTTSEALATSTTPDASSTTVSETTTTEALATSATPTDPSSTVPDISSTTADPSTTEPTKTTITRQSSIEPTTEEPSTEEPTEEQSTEYPIEAETSELPISTVGGGSNKSSIDVLEVTIVIGVAAVVGMCVAYGVFRQWRKPPKTEEVNIAVDSQAFSRVLSVGSVSTEPMQVELGDVVFKGKETLAPQLGATENSSDSAEVNLGKISSHPRTDDWDADNSSDDEVLINIRLTAGGAQPQMDGSGEEHMTGGKDDSEESCELKEALYKMQRDDKDAEFGQMLGDLNLGNALMEEDVVEDMGVVGETLGYEAEGGEGVVHCSKHIVGHSSTPAEEPAVVGESAAAVGHHTGGWVDMYKMRKMQRDEKDVRFGQMLSSLNVGNELMQEDVFDEIEGVPPTD